MYRVLIALALSGLWALRQDLPAVRLAGGGQAPASRTGQLPPLPVTHIDPRDVSLDSPRRLTLSFAEPRPIDEILALLTAGTRFSVAIDSDVSGAFRGELKQLTLRDALTTVLAPLGLEYQINGTVIRVRRRQIETRLFDLDFVDMQRSLARRAGSADATVVTAAAPYDPVASVEAGIRALLSDRGSLHVDGGAGLVQVTDFRDRLDRIALYVETLRQRRARQVRLQAQALQVTLRGSAPIDWVLVRERLGLRRDAPLAGVAADPAALAAALSSQGDVRVLWAPDVLALNNEPALVRMSSPGGASLTITVVPQIASDGIVQMSVSHALQAAGGAGAAEADSVMRVADGTTAVIAGLTSPAATGANATELVVLVRPTVVLPGTKP